MGGRALGRGGAATGLADDSAAVFYNPAGIAQLAASSASASFQMRALEKVTIERGLRAAELGDLDYQGSPVRAVYVSAIAKIGAADVDGFKKHAVAFSIVHPDQQSLSFGGSARADNDFADANITVNDDTVWTGLSYAYSLSPRWSFGISAFWSQRNYEHREAWVTAGDVQLRDYVDPDGNAQSAFGADRFVGSVRKAKLEVNSLVARLGVRHDLSPRWRIGLMLQPPSVALWSSGSVGEQRLSQGADAPGATFPTYYRSNQSVEASSPTPWEVRLGGAYTTASFAMDLDVLLHGPTGSADSPVVALSAPPADDYFGSAPNFPFLFAPQYHTNFIVNAALGAEGMISDVVPWSAGVFTDLSAAPQIEGPSESYALQHVNRYGLSASFGWRDYGYDILIGGAFVFGSGNSLVPDLEVGGYAVSEWSERTFVFFLSGEKSALERAAKSAMKGILEPGAP